MPALSIRQLAIKLDVSHNTIRNVMSDYRRETGETLGKSEGKGKPTYLTEYEQTIISNRVNVNRSNVGTVTITRYEPNKQELSKYQTPIKTITYGATDKQEFVATNIEVLQTNLETIQNNTESFDDALLAKYQSEGKELGFKIFEAKYGTAFQTLNDLEAMAAKKQELTKEVA